MRKLIEKTIFKNFIYNLEIEPFNKLEQSSSLKAYLNPAFSMRREKLKRWLTDMRKSDIRILMAEVPSEQLLKCLIEQHRSQFS